MPAQNLSEMPEVAAQSGGSSVTLERQISSASQAPADIRQVWTCNERLTYLSNFLHMTMYTICFGGIFDIFLYHMSQCQQVLLTTPLAVGPSLPHLPALTVNTLSEFELTFSVKPSTQSSYPLDSNCSKFFTCATSILHITDGSGNGDCCKVGNRIPFVYFANGTTRIHMAMDSVGQNESDDRKKYSVRQHCGDPNPLPLHAWTRVKIKASPYEQSKGKMNGGESRGGLLMFVNGTKVCEVRGARYDALPSREGAKLFLGSMQSPPLKVADMHIAASVEIQDAKYGKPASNFFVGMANSVQGLLSMALMYPIGWIGDKGNRYSFLRYNVWVAVVAGAMVVAAELYSNVLMLFAGLVVFTLYQQTISAMLGAVLTDNVTTERRTRSNVNYKTYSALAMAFGPALQLLVLLSNPEQDNWSDSTFELLLFPGWILLPFIGLSLSRMKPVGKQNKLSDLPSASEDQGQRQARQPKLSQAWLDTVVFCGLKRWFVVALSVNVFFIVTLMANGMTVRYFNLYFTQVLRFSPTKLCLLNMVCRVFIAAFVQLAKPLTKNFGRTNVAIVLHLASAVATLGIYGGGFFNPTQFVACGCYLLRFACLQTRDPILTSITMDLVPERQRSRWAALNSLRSLSFSASAVLGGYLADEFGYEYSFSVTVVALLASTVIMLPTMIWFPRKEGAPPAAAGNQAAQSLVQPPDAEACGEITPVTPAGWPVARPSS